MPALTSAMLYGHGVFTTLAVYGGRAFLWPQHWARLIEHADRTGVGHQDFSEETVGALLTLLIDANKVKTGRARITLLVRSVRGAWNVRGTSSSQTDLLIITGDARPPLQEDALALTLSPYRINSFSPLAGIKSTNYLDHILSWEEARARDFHEAVMLNERGEIVSATIANIFWVTNGTIHTPALSTGAIAGTTRACVTELARELSIPLVEGIYDLPHLGEADEIFLTSSAHGVAIVTMYDFRRYTVPVGSIALRLREAFRQLTLHANEN